MIYLANLKTRKIESFKVAEDALLKMRLESDVYQPIPNQKYVVRDRETGEYTITEGKNLQQNLGSGKTLMSPEDWAVEEVARSKGTKAGRFFSGLMEEATLGLDKLLGVDEALGYDKERATDLSDNPIARKVAQKEQEIYGTAENVGRITGAIGPFLATGAIASVARAGAKKATSALAKKALGSTAKGAKVASWAIPSSAVIRGADKAGKIARSKIAKMGVGKAGQATGEIATNALVYGAGAGVLQGIKTWKQALDQHEADKEFRGSKTAGEVMNSALGEGVRAFGETTLASGLFMAGGMGVFAGVGKALGLGASGARQLGAASGLSPQKMIDASQLKFWGAEPGARSRKNMEGIKLWFSGNKTARTQAERKKALDNVERFIDEEVVPGQSIFGKGKPSVEGVGKAEDVVSKSGLVVKDKPSLLKAIEIKKDEVGLKVGESREGLGLFLDKVAFKTSKTKKTIPVKQQFLVDIKNTLKKNWISIAI